MGFLKNEGNQDKSKLQHVVCMLSSFSCVWLFMTVWTVACQAPLSTRFSRQEYWSGSCPPPGDLPDPRIKLIFPALAGGFFTTEPPGKPQNKSFLMCRNSPLTISWFGAESCKEHLLGYLQDHMEFKFNCVCVCWNLQNYQLLLKTIKVAIRTYVLQSLWWTLVPYWNS